MYKLLLPLLAAAVGFAAESSLPAGTRVQVRLAHAIDTRSNPPGAKFLAHTSAPVTHNGAVLIPKGAAVNGHIVESKPSGRLKGRAVLALRLDSIESGGKTYRVNTASRSFVSSNHKKRNLGLIGGGAGTGAAIGAIAGGGLGALAGAGAGAAAGTTGALITGKKQVHLSAETPLMFTVR